jgi:hypothetical protein
MDYKAMSYKAMSQHETDKDRKILPGLVALTAAEAKQVAGGVSSAPLPPPALPGGRTVVTAAVLPFNRYGEPIYLPPWLTSGIVPSILGAADSPMF